MRGVRAVIMAGGRGERMRDSGVPIPKPLVEVSGTTLLELNVRALLAQGLSDVVVAAPASIPEVGAFVTEVLIGRYPGAALSLFTETTPLGNIGAAGTQARGAEHVLVVFADNLSSIDLADLVAAHRSSGAGLTLAAHTHSFAMPYGELVLDVDTVTGYREKPVIPVTVSSAYAVLGPAALAALPPGHAAGMVDLTRQLLAAGALVRAYRHTADWVDVNDAGSLERAAEVVTAHPELFAARAGGDH